MYGIVTSMTFIEYYGGHFNYQGVVSMVRVKKITRIEQTSPAFPKRKSVAAYRSEEHTSELQSQR